MAKAESKDKLLEDVLTEIDPVVRQLWLFMRSRKFKRKVDVQLLSMQKMLSTQCMHVIWV